MCVPHEKVGLEFSFLHFICVCVHTRDQNTTWRSWFQGSNSEHQAWQHVPLPAEPSCGPLPWIYLSVVCVRVSWILYVLCACCCMLFEPPVGSIVKKQTLTPRFPTFSFYSHTCLPLPSPPPRFPPFLTIGNHLFALHFYFTL